ncbi:MAG: carbohydrate porin [Hyphomicrobiales bacterium]
MKTDKKIQLKRLALILTLVAAGLTAPAQAADQDDRVHAAPPAPEQSDIWTRDKLFGDVGGLRTILGEHGIGIDLRLSQYYQEVASGGVDTNGEYGGTVDYRVKADLKKLIGSWDGLSVSMHARTRFGEDVNADAGAFALQNAGLLMPLPGDYNNTDITGLMVTQAFPFFGGRIGVVAGGKFDVIDLVTAFFPNVGYGQEGFWNVNGMVSALPWFGAVNGLSLYGGLAVTINPKYKAAESGFLFTGTENVSATWGSLSDSFDDGVWLAGFHRFFWDLDDKMGYFMVFAGGSTREQASNDPNDIVVIPGQGLVDTDKKKPWDVALYLYQDIWKAADDPNRKANIMVGGTVGPDDPQFAQWHFFANVEAFGLMESRPHDRMGVSGWYNGLSNNFKDLVSPVIELRDTWGFELYYSAEIIPSVHLTADLQFIQNQRKGDDFAIIPGVRLVADF